MAEITHRFITTNGIKMHIAECGSGPLVLQSLPYLQRMSVKISSIEVPNLKNKVVFPNVGHWVNQERAAECNKLIIDFLKQP